MTERGAVATGWPGMWHRGDMWEESGWRTPPNQLPVVLAFLALVLTAMTANLTGHAIAELGEWREQRAHYVAVSGRTGESRAGGSLVDFRGAAAPFGDLLLRMPQDEVEHGRDITVLVHRDDPSTYVLPADRADPLRSAAGAGATLLLALVSALLAASIVRSRRVDLEPVRRVAVRALDPVFPPAASPPRSRYETAIRVLPGIALVLWGLSHAPDSGPRPPRELVPLTGQVQADPSGTLVVHPRDVEFMKEWPGPRPLTGAELARGVVEGDDLTTTYALQPRGGEDPHAFASRWAFGGATAGFGLLALGFGIAWPFRLRRALASPPALVDVVGWSRRKRGVDWLYVAPAGATRPDQVAAIRLARGVVPPTAFTGPLYVHGTLRRWDVAIVRDPLGGPYWPAAPCSGWLRSTLHGYGPVVPLPPQPGA